MSLRFGTDGVRGVAGTELSPELVVALGRAAASTLGAGSSPGRPTFVVGRDTRLSGPLLQAALTAGLAAEGADVVDLGVLPTPGVAAVAADRGVPAAVISASHNPFQDNGIKLLSAGGRKLTDAEEERIEGLLAGVNGAAPGGGSLGGGALGGGSLGGGALGGGSLGRVSDEPSALGWYCDRVVAALEGRRLAGLRVVVDCANGAASETAPRILTAGGAEVVEVLSATPDGTNINRGCGSTDPSALAAAVVAHGADAGLALDGDADRVIAVDGSGAVVDGDRLLAMFAADLQSRGRLAGNTLVVTVMSNLGLLRAMAAQGIRVEQTAVGDRYVLETLDSGGWSLGGEQSGHIIFREFATTGDGVLSGLLLLDLIVRCRRTLADLADTAMVRLPQVLRNVGVGGVGGVGAAGASAVAVAGSDRVLEEVRAVEKQLGASGRVLLRPSGTEPLVRVMVEAETQEAAAAAADRLAAAVLEACAPSSPPPAG